MSFDILTTLWDVNEYIASHNRNLLDISRFNFLFVIAQCLLGLRELTQSV